MMGVIPEIQLHHNLTLHDMQTKHQTMFCLIILTSNDTLFCFLNVMIELVYILRIVRY